MKYWSDKMIKRKTRKDNLLILIADMGGKGKHRDFCKKIHPYWKLSEEENKNEKKLFHHVASAEQSLLKSEFVVYIHKGVYKGFWKITKKGKKRLSRIGYYVHSRIWVKERNSDIKNYMSLLSKGMVRLIREWFCKHKKRAHTSPSRNKRNGTEPEYTKELRKQLNKPTNLISKIKRHIDNVGSIKRKELKKVCVREFGCKSENSGSIGASIRTLKHDGYITVDGHGNSSIINSTQK